MICQKKYRQNEPAGQVDVSTRVKVRVMGILDMCRDHSVLLPVKNNTDRMNQLDR